MLRDLSHKDTAILKGMAISAIIFHDFIHWISPVRENEFTFDPSRFRIFLQTVPHPELAVQAVFSFFGHFGVQIFIFLSAYGLAKSHWDKPEPWAAFMWGRCKKLYPMFGLVIVPWMLLLAVASSPIQVLKDVAPKILLMLAGLSNFWPGYGLPPVGPWWFIPFILQFYAIWFFLRKLTIKFGWPGLLVLSIACLIIAYGTGPFLDRWSINLFESPIGHMPELCLGIVAARFPLRINAPVAFLAGALVLLGSLYSVLWPLTFISATVAMLWIYLKMRGTFLSCEPLEWIGRYSPLIFLVNGIVRLFFLPLATSPLSQLIWGCVSAATSFIVAATMHELLFRPRQPRGRTTGSGAQWKARSAGLSGMNE
jgi:peptidoglycan/LPS O-acetylase OafA/YrhL